MDALRLYQLKTGKLPLALKNKPTAKTDVDFYLDCFYRLSASRGRSEVGPQPLLVSEMAFYANLLGYTDTDDLLFFIDILQEADQKYLEIRRNKMEAQRAQAENESKSRNKVRSR